MEYQDIWNNNMINDYNKINNKLYVYDKWLDRYTEYINKSKLPIIDLGCGIGNDTLFLKSLGKEVISIDYSDEALRILNDNIEDVNILQMDFEKEWKLTNDSCDLIIADLSLHYFNERDTFKILSNIKNSLVDNGILIVRLNSIDDVNFGADSLEEIEHHFYYSYGIKKRFFDKEDIYYFFKDFEIISCMEESVNTIIYSKEKKVWECVFKK